MTVTDYDLKPGVGTSSSQPAPAAAAPPLHRFSSLPPPPESLRGSSPCLRPLRPHRPLSLQALGEGQGTEEWSPLLPAGGPPARSPELPAEVKPAEPSWDLRWDLRDASSSSSGSCPRGGSCSSLLPLRTTTPSSSSSPLWLDRSVPWVSSVPRHCKSVVGGGWGGGRATVECLCVSLSGLRHFAVLQLSGVGDKASGSVQLLPLNGESTGRVVGGMEGW